MDTKLSRPSVHTEKGVVLILLSLAVLISRSTGQSLKDEYSDEARQVFSNIFHNYNPRVQPYNEIPKSLEVSFNGTLVHLHSLDVQKQEMTTLLDFELSWRDTRISWYPTNIFEVSLNISSIWKPEFLYLNSASPPQAIRFHTAVVSFGGQVTWRRRDLVTTLCSTKAQNVTQTCPILLGLDSLKKADVTFQNDTQLTLNPDFSNHDWQVEAALVEEAQDIRRFVLTLHPLDQAQATGSRKEEEDKTCACSVTYSVNSGQKTGACSRFLRLVSSLVFLLSLHFTKMI